MRQPEIFLRHKLICKERHKEPKLPEDINQPVLLWILFSKDIFTH